MTGTLAAIAILAIGSAVWFGMQMFAWFLIAGRVGFSFRVARGLVIAALIGFPIVVLVILFFIHIFGRPSSAAEFILLPLATAWCFLLSWGGLRVAARLRGLLPPRNRGPNAEPDDEAGGNQSTK
jgi:hypothetical protein